MDNFVKSLVSDILINKISSTEWSSSSESHATDDELISRRKKTRISDYTETIVNQYTDVEFREHFRWPNEEIAEKSSQNFEKKKGLKYVIAAIDGSHIPIRKPVKQKDDFVNRKGFHSILIQRIVQENLKFIDVTVGEPGSLHDARMLRKSRFYRRAVSNTNSLFYGKYKLLGDSAYPRLNWLIPPYKDNGFLSEDERDFNYKQSATRIVVEHAFGLLKGRFRRLTKFDNLKHRMISKCVMAACVLHNICLEDNDGGMDLIEKTQ
ncbi:protein ANTAGONIST OF LIKE HETEROCHROMATIN PROTEIN 1-like [Anoplophora glabripennis]|uniref:protein ANTAGONIST OF LIKE HETEROCHROMATIN PROTEIN 1-like n=1 Tax=Anoplophora glabripennis TaxID=217634 RepID=UPI000C78F0C2|nr:protein ANTAGONIST OF LIKE HETEROCHROMATIN PROTEIN 1-like [Anoplophora glabripennis]